MSLLGLRAEQDDDPGGQPAGRGPPHPGMAGAAEVRPDWAPVARRIRDEATDSWDDRVAVERFTGKGGRFVRGDGPVRRTASRSPSATGPSRPSAASSSPPVRLPPSQPSRASPGRRTGPTARRSRPTRCPGRWSCSAAARSAGAGAGLRPLRRAGDRARGARPAARGRGARGVRAGREGARPRRGHVRTGVAARARRATTDGVHPARSRTGPASRGDQLLVATGRRAASAGSTWPRPASTRTPGPSRSTS